MAKSFPSSRLFWALTLCVVARPLAAQTAEESPQEPAGFQRRYLDPVELRDARPQLRDWPALSRLVLWADGLETALAEDDRTLTGELLAEFRSRVDSLAAGPLPPVLAERADTVGAVLRSLTADLDRADQALAALPPPPATTGDEAPNAPEQQRTLVTGRTAVTVPSGVQVGEADSLPTAALEDGGLNFLDLMALALADLDRLVHLTRTAGAPTTDPPSGRSSPLPDTAPPLPAP